MKKVAFLLMIGAFALVFVACPLPGNDDGDDETETEQTGGETEGETGGETGGEGEGETGEETGGNTGGITGNSVSAVSNCVFFIEGERFTSTGGYTTATYMTKRVPVILASGSVDQVEPVGDAIVFARLGLQDTWSVYYLLKGQNKSNDDFQYVYARGLNFTDDDSSFSKRIDATLYGRLRETDTDNQTSHNIGLRPDDEGYFFTTSASSITGTDFAKIDRAELTTSLTVNAGSPPHTEVEAKITVLGYRYGERDGNMGLEISIQNSGNTDVQLNKNPRVFLMNGDDVTLFHGSFTRFPTGGLIQPGETGGYFQSATDLGNASADKVMIILDYQDPPR